MSRQQYAVERQTKDFEYQESQSMALIVTPRDLPAGVCFRDQKATGRDDYQTVLREFIKRMTRIKTDDGKPVFPNSQIWPVMA